MKKRAYKRIRQRLRAERYFVNAKMKETRARAPHFHRTREEEATHKYWQGRAESYDYALMIIWEEN
jgi:hypothetical protein